MKTIAVVGHLVQDRIVNQTGRKVESFGGIANSLAALGTVVDSSIRVLPVCNIGYDLYDKAKAFFEKFPPIDFSLVNRIDIKNKIHELKYNRDGYRQEINIGELPLITTRLFKNCDKIDLALVNYIGGDEYPAPLFEMAKRQVCADHISGLS